MREILNLFFPPRCLACDAVLELRGNWCQPCSERVLLLPTIHCRICSEPGWFSEGASPHGAQSTCARCRTLPPPFTRAFAPFEHDGAIARAIHRFKYEAHPELAQGLVVESLSAAPTFISALQGTVCPVPLHDARYCTRGFDQAALLAVQLAKHLARPFTLDALTRIKPTQRQVGLTEDDRDDNMRDAFRANSQHIHDDMILVDDVMTTGSTARAAARALLNAGAKRVSLFTIARAPRLIQYA